MQFYWINALSPLVFRSGKPFGAQSDTEDIIFPLPSAAAGLIRTVWAQQQHGFDGHFNDEVLRQKSVNGLFLAKHQANSTSSGEIELFVPKPSDAIYLKNKATEKIELIRLSPVAFPENSGCDLPHSDLLPVQMEKDTKSKPQGGKQFWALKDWLAWQNGNQLSFEEIDARGVNLPSPEVRTHVAIDGDSLAGQDGLLFQTAAYDFANQRRGHHQGWEDSRLGFVIASAETLQNDTVRFGGEGRLSRLEQVKIDMPSETSIPTDGLKITLLTPAIFEQGWLPAWVDKDSLEGKLPNTNITVKLKAAAIDRWQPVSGWDLAKHKPKATRKAVSAGSVYWFEIKGGDVVNELGNIHLQAISDDEQDKRDGFGIAAVASWKIK